MHNHKLKPYSNVKPKENLKVLSFSKCPQSIGPMLKLVLTKMIKQIYTHTHYHKMNVIFQPVAHTKHQR